MIPAAFEMQHRYQDLNLPVVIVAGTQDRIVDVERHAIRLHREVAQSRLRLIPDVGHMVHYAVPEEVAKAIGDAANMQNAAVRKPPVTDYEGRVCLK